MMQFRYFASKWSNLLKEWALVHLRLFMYQISENELKHFDNVTSQVFQIFVIFRLFSEYMSVSIFVSVIYFK